MARINIEDSLYKDARFMQLCFKLGSLETAIGALVRVWTVAQEFYLKDDRKIPIEVWKQQILNNAVIDCGLAIEENGRISVVDADKHFSWLLTCVESGRKGGKSKKVNNNKRLTEGKGTLSHAKGTVSEAKGTVSERKPLTLTLSPTLTHSPSLSPTQSLTLSQKEEERILPSEQKCSHGAEESEFTHTKKMTWQSYCDAYKQRYKTEPVRNATVNTQVQNLVKRLGKEAPEVAAFYLTHNKAFYVEKCHPIGLCLQDAEALRTQWARGQKVLSSNAREIERVQHNRNSFELAFEAMKRDEEEMRKNGQ